MRNDPLIGEIIADRFKVVSLIGEGGTGRVYLAEHNVLERLFAIKVLRPELISDQTAAERFRREARAASRMQHRNIVYISDFGALADDRLYLVMEYIPGEELATVLHREGALPPPRAAQILLQVVDALDYAHEQGVVHRDLKAENVLLTQERRKTDVVKILDFGLAKILEGTGRLDTLSAKGQVFGTPEYISPEQIVGDPVDPRTDIYSIGVLAFELVVGRTPFTGSLMELLVAHRKTTPPLPSQAAPDRAIPACFDEIVSRAMQKRPEDRFSTAAEIGRILGSYLRATGAGRGPSEVGFDRSPSPAPPPTLSAPAGPTAPKPGAAPATSSPFALASSDPDQATASARQRIRNHVRHAAAVLQARGASPAWFSQALNSLQQMETQLQDVETQLTSLETRSEELDLSGREQESQLRYAIIELGMEKSRLQQDAASGGEKPYLPEIADLSYQVGELERRLATVARDREAQLDAADQRILELRRQMEDQAAARARSEDALLAQLLSLRTHVAALPEVQQDFIQIDALLSLVQQQPPATTR